MRVVTSRRARDDLSGRRSAATRAECGGGGVVVDEASVQCLCWPPPSSMKYRAQRNGFDVGVGLGVGASTARRYCVCLVMLIVAMARPTAALVGKEKQAEPPLAEPDGLGRGEIMVGYGDGDNGELLQGVAATAPPPSKGSDVEGGHAADTSAEAAVAVTETEDDTAKPSESTETVAPSSFDKSDPQLPQSEKETPQSHRSRSAPTGLEADRRLEAEARTARELSRAVQALRSELDGCTDRVDATKDGFQKLYAAHLTNVDGLRKCREGFLGKDEIDEVSERRRSFEEGIDEELWREAHQREEEAKRHLRDETLAQTHRELISSLETQVRSLRLREEAWERTISELVSRRDLLERREGAWERTIAELMTEVKLRTERESWYEDMEMEMTGRIAMLSRSSVLEKFGPGPHRVSIVVALDDDKEASHTSLHQEHEILIELAPLDLMPHSVYLFLTQISEGYWSRGSPALVINAGHVLQACPHPCLESVSAMIDAAGDKIDDESLDPYREMKEAGVDSVSFQEYHPLYPHEKYTVGFAGRPHSGPEFYFNLLNNTLDHGGGEGESGRGDADGRRDGGDASLEPDPCFGRVIKGFDVVDRIVALPTRASLPKMKNDERNDENDEDFYYEGEREDDESFRDTLLLRPVRIVSFTIVDSYNARQARQKEEVVTVPVFNDRDEL